MLGIQLRVLCTEKQDGEDCVKVVYLAHSQNKYKYLPIECMKKTHINRKETKKRAADLFSL